MKILKIGAVIIINIALQGCATIGMLPKSVNNVDFDSLEGKTGWSQYQQVETFRKYTTSQIYDALKVGLGDAGFSLRMADKNNGVIIGEHGITLHDWNVIAGCYFKEEGENVKVKIIIEGSKDIGISGDVTSDGWTGKILKGTREYLNNTHQSILKVDREDLKNN